MRLNGKLTKKGFTIDGNLEITIQVSSTPDRAEILNLDDREMQIEIKEISKNRTGRQNRQLWVLIGEIAKRMKQDDMEVYINALELANAKYEYIACLEKAEAFLREGFRAVQFVKPHDVEKGTNVYKCYYGSSKMTTKEMGEVIDQIMFMANEVGIDTDYWKGELK